MTVAERIKEFLKFKGISVNSFSQKLDMSQTTLNRQFNGTVTLSVETVKAVLDYFPDMSAEWLMRGAGEKIKSDSMSERELEVVCIEQSKEIVRLKMRIQELEGEKKLA